MVDESGQEPVWRPGLLGRLRALIRRALRATLGSGGERRFHTFYHTLLRATGRFTPPEDAVTATTLSMIAARSATILDIGANVGRYSWFLRRQAPAGTRLFALEPHPGAAALLRTALRGARGCTVLELGASDVDGSAALMVPEGAFGSSVSGLAWVRTDGHTDAHDQPKIRVRRIDALIEDGLITISRPVFLKIDVEGGEYRVLRGAVELLRRHRPILYFECQTTSLARHGATPAQVWDELRRSGYQIFANRSGRFEPVPAVDASTANYLAIPDLGGDEPVEAPLDAIVAAWAARTTKSAQEA